MGLSIAIAASGLPFDGGTLDRRGLGGSETAVICVARELAKLGHQVTVFSNPDQPGRYDDVVYLPLQNLHKVSQLQEWDVFIASRQWDLLASDIRARYRVLWCHDVFVQPQMYAHLWQTDQVFLLSDYHIKDYLGHEESMEQLSKIIFKTNNGIDIDQIDRIREQTEKVPGKIIYTSRPERGLHYLLQMLPKILAVRPDAKVYYCNYSLGKLVPHKADQARLDFVEQLLKKFENHVVNLGHLTKEELYREIASAEVMAYPTAFPEISCITAMEAAACGTPIVTTNDFALQETVGHNKTGFLINGRPDGGRGAFELDAAYSVKFVRKVLQVLNATETLDRLSKGGPKWIEQNGFTWSAVAQNWTDHFESEMQSRYDAAPVAVSKELRRLGYFVAADSLAGKETPEEVAFTFDDVDTYMNLFNSVKQQLDRPRIFLPKTILDFNSANPYLAAWFARVYPEAEITVVESCPEVRELIADTARENGVEDRVNFVDTPEGTYDLVLLSEVLDRVVDPSQVFAYANTLSSGKIALISREGAVSDFPMDNPSRAWSIGARELQYILGKAKADLSFMRTGKSSYGEPIGYWVSILDHQENFNNSPIPISDYTKCRPYQKLTVCMIAKDAEDWIIRCLKRLLEVADRVSITIDKRTTDRTVMLLESFNDDRISWKFEEFETFDQMRNASIESAGEDKDPGWVFWVDTDEILVQETPLRRFLYSRLFEGFATPQCHLMLDVHGTRDVPIRIFRAGNPSYRFVGYIHEHCEDTSKGGYDNPIMPAMVIDKVKLAHYGYENEPQRRAKCSNRNMELLQRDLRENPNRMITKLLALRDYLHIVKWELEARVKAGIKPPIAVGSELHRVAEAGVSMYQTYLCKKDNKYKDLATPMYQEMLSIMSACGLPYKDSPTPPFSVASAITAGVGGPADQKVTPELVWFVDLDEATAYFNNGLRSMARQIAPYPDEVLDALLPSPKTESRDDEVDPDGKLLGLGINRIDKHGILI